MFQQFDAESKANAEYMECDQNAGPSTAVASATFARDDNSFLLTVILSLI
jgi:hypothetical protein